MKTGDLFTDASGRGWTIGQPLGRGTWGRSWLVRDEHGREAVWKEPLSAADLPAHTPDAEQLLAGSRDAVAEQAAWLERAVHPWLPRLEGRVDRAGVTSYLMPRYPTSLARKIEAGGPIDEALDVVARAAETLARTGHAHGNLRPGNILLTDRDEVVLADPISPAVAELLARLDALWPDRDTFRPPEAAGARSATTAWDTWALCASLYLASTARPPTGDARRVTRVHLPTRGLDKIELAALKDRALSRLGEPGCRSNPRFRSRLADRLASMLNRGLSAEREPSPPYRFDSATTLLPRLQEVVALVAPEVLEVGKLIPNAPEGLFQGSHAVGFSVNVACTPGIHDREDLAAGLQLVDLDAGEQRIPLQDVRVDMKTHPSGRLRFEFGLTDIPPGRYRLRVAFSIRDAGVGPQTSQSEFSVRPPPGWVPPPVDAGPQPILLPRAPTADVGSEVATVLDRPSSPAEARSEPTSSPGAEVIEGLFPRPIPPPDDEPSSVPSAPAAMAPRPFDPPTRTSPSEPSGPWLVEVTAEPTTGSELDADDLDSEEIEEIAQLPPPPVPRPAPPAPSRAPSVAPRPAPGRSGLATQAPPPATRGPGRWEPIQAEEDELVIGRGLPGPRGGMGDDLPSLEGMDPPKRSGRGNALERVLDAFRNDSRFAIGGAIALSLLLILFTMGALKFL
jgi:hypothetical protein